MKRLTDNTHPSHDFHPDDDVIACDVCGCRTYNGEANQPCQGTKDHDLRDAFVELAKDRGIDPPDGATIPEIMSAIATADGVILLMLDGDEGSR